MNWLEFGAAVAAVIVALNLAVAGIAVSVSKLAAMTENKTEDKVAKVLNLVAHYGNLLVVLLKRLGLAKDKSNAS